MDAEWRPSWALPSGMAWKGLVWSGWDPIGLTVSMTSFFFHVRTSDQVG
jgi:hypothetical protein